MDTISTKPTQKPRPKPATTTQPCTAVAPFTVAPVERAILRNRLFNQVVRAWKLADLAGMRRAQWSNNENRELILRQRIAALSDADLVTLCDREPQVPQRGTAEMLEVAKAQCFTTNRVQLHVPGFALINQSP